MTEAERLMAEGEKRGLERGVKQGEKKGLEKGLAPLVRLYERRLGRTLADPERATLGKRLETLGPASLYFSLIPGSPSHSSCRVEAWRAHR